MLFFVYNCIVKLITIILIMMNLTLPAQQFHYAVAKMPAPVLNSHDFRAVFGGRDGSSLKIDDQGLIREIEFIALPGTVFELLGEYDYGSHKIYKVETNEYQYNTELFIDSRFVELSETRPPERKITLPSEKDILEFLDKVTGKPYCWGGSYNEGIKLLEEIYPPAGEISDHLYSKWILEGCDCSGLMYEATNGYTPRNTSKMITFGEAVEIAGLSATQISEKLLPLDMIVWNGHVIYVYDKNTAIQSSLSHGGVVKTDLKETIAELMKTRKPVNDYNSARGKRFVVRRWYSE